MEFFYCFANVSLTLRVLSYLSKKWRSHLDCVTVIFLNDCWVLRIVFDSEMEPKDYQNCQAVLDENGLLYYLPLHLFLVFQGLDAGESATEVMNRYHVAIVSHGDLEPDEVRCFQNHFVAGLGYRPPSLV